MSEVTRDCLVQKKIFSRYDSYLQLMKSYIMRCHISHSHLITHSSRTWRWMWLGFLLQSCCWFRYVRTNTIFLLWGRKPEYKLCIQTCCLNTVSQSLTIHTNYLDTPVRDSKFYNTRTTVETLTSEVRLVPDQDIEITLDHFAKRFLFYKFHSIRIHRKK
jgi:hypothetical protein